MISTSTEASGRQQHTGHSVADHSPVERPHLANEPDIDTPPSPSPAQLSSPRTRRRTLHNLPSRPVQRRQPLRRTRERSPSPPQPPPFPSAAPVSRDPRVTIAPTRLIPNGTGWGLFATVRLNGGTDLGEYVGERLTDAELRRRYNINDSGQAQRPIRYVLEVNRNDGFMYTDGRDPAFANELRYINHVPRYDPRCNCEFTDDGNVVVRDGFTIAAGGELGISYGGNHNAAHFRALEELARRVQREREAAALPPPEIIDAPHRMHGLLWNAQGLLIERRVALCEYLIEHRPLFAVITETHRTASAPPIRTPHYCIHEVPSNRRSGGSGGLMILVRADIAGSVLVPDFGVNFAGAPADATAAFHAEASTQWMAVHINVKGVRLPLTIIAAYIQPATHAIAVPLLSAQLAALHRRDGDAMTILAGDLNYSDSERLGSRTALPPASAGSQSDILTALSELDFSCASAELAFGQHTHLYGGVLDLIHERAHPAAEHIIHAINVDNGVRSLSTLHSDHYPVRAELTIAWPLEAVAAADRKVWDTERATDEKWDSYCTLLNALCNNNSQRFTAPQRHIAGELSSLLHRVDTFVVHDTDTETTYRARAQPIADQALTALEDAVKRAALDCIGQRTKKPYQRKGYTREIHQLRRAHERAERAVRCAPDDEQHAALAAASEARIRYRQALSAVHAAQWDELRASLTRDDDDPDADPDWAIRNKLVWSKVRQHQLIASRSPPLTSGIRKPDGSLTTSAQDSVDTIAQHYRTAFVEHPRTAGSAYNQPDTAREIGALRMHLAQLPPIGLTHTQMLADCPNERVSSAMLEPLLRRTPLHTAPGPDGITGPLLRHASGTAGFLDALAHLINFCHAFHVWPQGWRDDNKLPLFKRGGDAAQCKSYRPIALTSVLSRMVERLLCPRYTTLLDPLLSRWQQGFRKRRSTQQCVLFMLQRIQEAVHRPPGKHGESVPYPVAFLDIIAAYDTVPHELLLLKLYRAGVRGRLLQFVRAFLAERRFRVISHTATSDWTPVAAGVPQGAVLAVLFFILYINDMLPNNDTAEASASTCFRQRNGTLLYADDAAAAPPSSSRSRIDRANHLQDTLTGIGRWADTWGVRFSASKSGCIWFRAPLTRGKTAADQRALTREGALRTFSVPCPSDPSLTIHIPNVEQYKYLGVWLHQAMSPTKQVEHVVQSATAASNLVRTMLSYRSPPSPGVVRQLSLSLIQPRVTYSLPFVNATPTQLNRLTGLLLRPLLSVTSTPITAHRRGECVFFGILPFDVQKELSLIRLASSCLQAVQSPVHPDPAHVSPFSLPAALSTRRMLRPEAVRALARAIANTETNPYTHESQDVRQALHYPTAQMQRALFNWRLASTLPVDGTDGVSPDWNATQLRAAALRAAGLQSVSLWLLETMGAPLATSQLHHWQLRSAGSLRPNAAALHPRGARLVPFLGINPSSYRPVDAVALPRRPLPSQPSHAPAAQRPAHQLGLHMQPSLSLDPAPIVRARTRLALNRADFAAVRNPRAPIEQQLCTYCSANAIDDAHHVLTQCTRFEPERERLRVQLRAAMIRVKQRLSSPLPIYAHLRPYRHLYPRTVRNPNGPSNEPPSLDPSNNPTDNALLHLFCLGTAPLLHILEHSMFARTLRHTAIFIQHIRTVRPV